MIAIIADDLTGAAEIAGAAVRAGLAVEVQTQFQRVPTDVLVLDANTRSLTPNAAANVVRTLAQRILSAEPDWLYVKVDSVLRGPVLAQLVALADTCDTPGILLINANPQRGRCVIQGQLTISGVPLSQTDLARDLEHPATSAFVCQLLRAQEFPQLSTRLVEPTLQQPFKGLMVANVADTADLQAFASKAWPNILFAGGTEFFAALLEHRCPLPLMARPISALVLSSKTLVVCGSALASSARRQFCQNARIPWYELPILTLPEVALNTQPVQKTIQQDLHRHPVVMVGMGPQQPDPQFANPLKQTMARMVATILTETPVNHLLVEGGGNASTIIRQMGWQRLRVAALFDEGFVGLEPVHQEQPMLIVKPGSYSWPRNLFPYSYQRQAHPCPATWTATLLALVWLLLLTGWLQAADTAPASQAIPTMDALESTYQQTILPILQNQCFDCHDTASRTGGVDLMRFAVLLDCFSDRATWKAVFDVVEAGTMPLHDSGYELSKQEQQQVLTWITQLLCQPEPNLQAVDPGKPVLRRLNRLEYNNTVRDLFELPIDIFPFPERLPVADKHYYLTANDTLGSKITTSMREYGQKYDVLLPLHGLPGDNRAEYGYSNRGDALNMSALLLEKYLELAQAIAHQDRLQQESPVLQALLGDSLPKPKPVVVQKSSASTNKTNEALVAAVATFAPNNNIQESASGNDSDHTTFQSQIQSAFLAGLGGVFDIPATLNNQRVAGKGGLLRLSFGSGACLTINPNSDLWLAAFASAAETSGGLLLTNAVPGEKTFELTFNVLPETPILQLGVCVLSRRQQQGKVTLTAVLTDGQQLERTATLAPETGNVFFSFSALPDTGIRRLRVDGSSFTGDYILLDDLGFIVARSGNLPPSPVQTALSQAEVGQNKKWNSAAVPLAERLEYFLQRAFRRAVRQEEVETYMQLIGQAQAAGATPAAAILLAVQTVLASPEFLFLAEPVQPQADLVRRLTDTELATRLSYFLWSSAPDEELLTLAIAKRLSQPEVLQAQVRRLLAARHHSRELSESFAVQWLRLDQLYSAKPDRKLFPRFYQGPQGKATLHADLMTEALLLFETVLVENRSVLELVDADYTWLSPRLAELYDLRTVLEQQYPEAVGSNKSKGPAKQWYRCRLPDRNRGGVLTMGGPLLITSLPFRTSPVKRGAWLLETIFHRPPSEPKVAFVLDDKPTDHIDLTALTIRQRFEKHRTDPNCYSCHSRIDPPGFSLEAFDAIGAWRTQDGSQPIDATGEWQQIPFDGPAAFKAALRQREAELVRGFVEHLLSYALGRKLEYFDMPAVNHIVDAAAVDKYRFASIIAGIVQSYPFQHTRNDK